MPNFVVFCTLPLRLWGVKIVLDMHDPMPEIYEAHFHVPADHWIIRLMKMEEKLSCRYADYLITVNEPIRELLIQRGIDPDRIEVVMNFPDTSIFSPDGFNSTKTSGGDGKFKLVYTGLVSQRNGLDIAVEAMRLLRDEMTDIYLLIVGSGTHLPYLKELVRKYDMFEKIVFKKPVMIDEVPGLLMNCELGISPHRDNAFTRLMFSTKVAEYLSLGLPVISASTWTMERYFDDSVLFYFEPGSAPDFADQVRLIRNSPELVETKKIEARERMPKLNWKEERKKYSSLVESWAGAERLNG